MVSNFLIELHKVSLVDSTNFLDTPNVELWQRREINIPTSEVIANIFRQIE